ncbi:MAG: translation initiation factor IF-1 [Candidatus Latescibacteria bacterium]|nr:translation initiation factor IF-1 [Candidatus Latescibacterota bacterium]
MAKEEKVSLEGTVTDTLPDGQYMVEVEGGHEILGYTSGKMRRFNIRVLVGDRVTIETSPYDLNRGRIVWLHRLPPPDNAGGKRRGGGNRPRRRR